MKNEQHTPGPWWFCESTDGFYVSGCGGEEYTRQISKADARLIAVAPELLAALELLVQAVDHYASAPEDWPEMYDARAAIAKARGEG